MIIASPTISVKLDSQLLQMWNPSTWRLEEQKAEAEAGKNYSLFASSCLGVYYFSDMKRVKEAQTKVIPITSNQSILSSRSLLNEPNPLWTVTAGHCSINQATAEMCDYFIVGRHFQFERHVVSFVCGRGRWTWTTDFRLIRAML